MRASVLRGVDSAGFGLAFGGQRSLLTRIASFALGLGLDEPALLDLRQRGGNAKHEAEQSGNEELQDGRSFAFG